MVSPSFSTQITTVTSKYDVYKSCESRDITSLFCLLQSRDCKINGRFNLVYKSPKPCVFTLPSSVFLGILEVEIKRLYFIIWHHVTPWSRLMWLCGWDLFTLNNNCVNFKAYRSSGSGDMTFLFCHMTSQDQMTKETCDFAGRNPSPSGSGDNASNLSCDLTRKYCLGSFPMNFSH